MTPTYSASDIEVLSGLDPAAAVILVGKLALADAQPVNAVEQK